ncbi:hypothetical protein H9P43_000835 [Blastocladiella emersonii ATCC 22665]|nr:hypothetical protein H9P43_000835 [Blastocladiella emersonii ATCC 22665]
MAMLVASLTRQLRTLSLGTPAVAAAASTAALRLGAARGFSASAFARADAPTVNDYVFEGIKLPPPPPKRPANGYALFTKDMMQRRPDNVTPQDWFAKLPETWNSLPPHEKSQYDSLYKQHKATFDAELAAYNQQYSELERSAYERFAAAQHLAKVTKKGNRLAKATKVKTVRAKTSYQQFVAEFKKSPAVPDSVKNSVTELAKLASVAWANMTDADKAPYVRLYEQEKAKLIAEGHYGDNPNAAAKPAAAKKKPAAKKVASLSDAHDLLAEQQQ